MKKILDFIKDYFTIIVSIPPLLGAIWQIINLSKISFSYIRFFSVTQLIADGIIILITIILISFYPFIFFFGKSSKPKEETETESEYFYTIFTKVKNISLSKGIFSLVFSFFLIYEVYKFNIFFIKNLDNIFTIFTVLPINIILYLAIPILALRGKNYLINYNTKTLKIISQINILFLILITIIIANLYYNRFNQLMLFPDNLENQTKIENKLNESYPNKKVELIYNNDKYLFYSISSDSIKKNDKIKIVPFEELFED